MKRITNYLLASLVTCFVLAGCGKDDDSPKPKPTPPAAAQSAFTADKKVVEFNETVTFANTSTNATRYEWDFGNGKTSTDKNPTTTYTTAGTHTIKLTAYNSENVANVTTQTIKAGERYLTGISIKSLNFSTASGGNWDVGNGPDLRLTMGKVGGAGTSFNLDQNVTQSMLPLNYSIAATTVIKFTNENWGFLLDDVDATSNEIMGSWQGSPVASPKNNEDGKGVVLLKTGLNHIELNFEIK